MNVSLGLVRALVLGLALARIEIAFCQEAETDNAPAPLEELEKTPEPAPSDQTGLAAYYHTTFQGRRTANGESFDHKGLTAAHKTLPFGTLVRVINLRNNKSVIVRVNDRGPNAARSGDRPHAPRCHDPRLHATRNDESCLRDPSARRCRQVGCEHSLSPASGRLSFAH